MYAYCVLPNGLSPGPRYFTKLMKPVFAHLRSAGHMSVSFIDDIYLQGDTIARCKQNILETKQLLEKLGFLIHQQKLVLEPTKEITFLGFVWDSEAMAVKLIKEKVNKVKTACGKLLVAKTWSIRVLAQVKL